MGLVWAGLRHTLQTCLSLLARRPSLPAPGARAATASACAPTQGLTSAAAGGAPAPPEAEGEQPDSLPTMLVPRAVALQGGAPPQPAPKRRKLDAPALSPPARPASAREVARREWGPPQFASVLPALYTRHGSTAAEAAAIASGETLPAPPKKGQAPRPNHFLALQVSHAPGVVSAIQRVQASVAKHSPHLKKACVDAISSHLTLGVMALNSEEELEAARQAMLALGAELQRQGLAGPLELSLAGLSSFNDQVLYLDVEEGESLQQLLAVAAAVRAHFDAAGLLQDGNRAFVPHVTVAKMSKMPRAGRRGGGGKWRDGQRGKGGAKGKDKEKGRRHGGRDRDWRGAYEALLVADEEAGMEMAGTVETAAGGEEEAAAGGSSVGGASVAEAGGVAAMGGVAGEEATEEEEDMGPAKVADEELEAGGAEGVAAGPAGRQDRRGKHSRRSADGGEGERQRQPHIPPESYVAHTSISCGRVQVAEVQLCRMLGRQPGQYYPVVTCVALAAAEEAADAAAEAGGSGAA